MPKHPLDNIKLGYSLLGHEIYLYRGSPKRPYIALDKRKAEFDVMSVITQHMMDDSPKGSIKTYTLDGIQYYKLTIVPCEAPEPTQTPPKPRDTTLLDGDHRIEPLTVIETFNEKGDKNEPTK